MSSFGHLTSFPFVDDGIYEPNTLIRLSAVHFTNIGPMTLPAGCVLSFPSNPTVFSLGYNATLPSCAPLGSEQAQAGLVIEGPTAGPNGVSVGDQKEFLLRLPDAAPTHGLQSFRREV